MLTEKENLLEFLKKDGKPERLVNGYDAFRIIGGDPVGQFVRGNRIKGTDSYDRWGCFISWPEDQLRAIPIITPENQVIQDIEEWQKYVKVPDLRANCSTGWETALANKKRIQDEGYLATTIMGTGVFEELHMLMTFEDTLCNFLMYPDEMHELIDVIVEYRMEYFRLIVENLHPDAIISHDDWGSKDTMLMSPEVWREFFKEPYRKMYEYLHENGILILHHSDSFCEPIAKDMEEIGIDIWQGVIPSNDICKIAGELKGDMVLFGGIDSILDREDTQMEEVQAEVNRCCDTYGHIRNFIPGWTYGDPDTLYPHVKGLVSQAITNWNKEHFKMD